jgi:hypothetical protein
MFQSTHTFFESMEHGISIIYLISRRACLSVGHWLIRSLSTPNSSPDQLVQGIRYHVGKTGAHMELETAHAVQIPTHANDPTHVDKVHGSKGQPSGILKVHYGLSILGAYHTSLPSSAFVQYSHLY